MNPIEFPRAVPTPREFPPARPTWIVTWEETDDEGESIVRLLAGTQILTRRVRLNSHAEAGA